MIHITGECVYIFYCSISDVKYFVIEKKTQSYKTETCMEKKFKQHEAEISPSSTFVLKHAHESQPHMLVITRQAMLITAQPITLPHQHTQ